MIIHSLYFSFLPLLSLFLLLLPTSLQFPLPLFSMIAATTHSSTGFIFPLPFSRSPLLFSLCHSYLFFSSYFSLHLLKTSFLVNLPIAKPNKRNDQDVHPLLQQTASN
uniref:Uncharacterized protein n=1 Tax=Nelumbo nucifera TaxID=4432 RepID=A0A822ZGL2_NELNU|nr:TPA_asm: hypothetical protein HUJ06_001973 [Nelumbo nucifera]